MLDEDFREQLARYLAGRIRRATLENWIVPDAWTIAHEADPVTRERIFRTMRLLAERANGDWTEPEVKAQLSALLDTYVYDAHPRVVRTGSFSQTVTKGRAVTHPAPLVGAAGRSHEAVSA